MTREELIAYDRWLTENKWGSSEIITPEQAADLYLAKHPLPPAEGAEKSCLSCRFHNSPTYHDKMWCRDCQQLSHYEQQPTAEGAEEITAKEYLQNKYPQMRGHLWNSNEHINDDWIAEMMTEFATLHAQRIADKMVKENLVEFGNMIRDEPNGDIAALAEYFIRTINLKTREK